jgi:hypothetical protein
MNSFQPSTCLCCQNPLIQLPTGRTRKYDSDGCRKAASRERQLKRLGRRTRSTAHATIVPCTLEEANRFVRLFHRHHGQVLGARFCLAIADRLGLVRGVAIVGRPSGRQLVFFMMETPLKSPELPQTDLKMRVPCSMPQHGRLQKP